MKRTSVLKESDQIFLRVSKRVGFILIGLAVLAGTAVALRIEGRLWWCAAGDFRPWTGDAWGPHNSQHLFDPYSLTHVSHGFVLWGLLWLFARRVSLEYRLIAGLGIESLWEILENSTWVIDRYRTATAAVGYTGDTIINSIGDIIACGIGLVVAQRIGWRWSVAIVMVLELVLIVWIRDNLLLNVVMLIHPIDAIRNWQMN